MSCPWRGGVSLQERMISEQSSERNPAVSHLHLSEVPGISLGPEGKKEGVLQHLPSYILIRVQFMYFKFYTVLIIVIFISQWVRAKNIPGFLLHALGSKMGQVYPIMGISSCEQPSWVIIQCILPFWVKRIMTMEVNKQRFSVLYLESQGFRADRCQWYKATRDKGAVLFPRQVPPCSFRKTFLILDTFVPRLPSVVTAWRPSGFPCIALSCSVLMVLVWR